jgi:hypothetical protein
MSLDWKSFQFRDFCIHRISKMSRIGRFTLRISKSEEQMIRELSARLQRSQSDAVRLLIREAAKELSLSDDGAVQAAPSEQVAQNE